MNQRPLAQRFVSVFLGVALLAAAAACGGGSSIPPAVRALSAPSTANPERAAALATLLASESSTRSAQDSNGGDGGGSDDWKTCPPSGHGDEAWPNGANWHWDGHHWWHWSNHHWGEDKNHTTGCNGGSGSGGGTTTTTAYDAITPLNLVVAGGVTGIFTNNTTGTAVPYGPTVNQTLVLAAINLSHTCVDPGPTTQSAARMTTQGTVHAMAGGTASGTPAPTAAPLPPTVCEIVEYTNGANPVVVDGPGGSNATNSSLGFTSVSGVSLTAGNSYTFYLVYPVTTTTGGTPAPSCAPNSGGSNDGEDNNGDNNGGYGDNSGNNNGGYGDNNSGNGDNSYWDGSSWWGWNGSEWCHNQTPAPSCTSSPDHNSGDGSGDHSGDGGGDGSGGGDG